MLEEVPHSFLHEIAGFHNVPVLDRTVALNSAKIHAVRIGTRIVTLAQ